MTGPEPDVRARQGKAARARARRSSHAVWECGTGRRDPVEVLEEQGEGRIPELEPIRYARMLASPFAFFRGGAALMAADLADSPTSGFTVQLCGDAHAANFGLFASPERRLVFDLNDFDETARGPWEWDVKRLAASLEVAGRDNGYSPAARRRIVLTGVGAYREAVRRFAALRHMELWYEHLDVEDRDTLAAHGLDADARRRVTRAAQRARRRDSDRAVRRLTEMSSGRRRFVADPPLIEPLRDLVDDSDRADLESRLDHILHAYRRSLTPERRWLLEQFHLVDVARKVVGVGSVGTRCWVVLLTGRDADDTLVLQVKEAGASVLTPYAGHRGVRNEGRRVVLGQRHMQATSDIFLGWHRSDGLDGVTRDFYVRQLADWKGGARFERMRPRDLRRYGALCGRTLARAHARSGDRIAIASYLGKSASFDRAVAEFAVAYADQNSRDHAALQQAVSLGRVDAAQV